MNLKNKNTQFILFWILLHVFFNWIEYIHLPPFGMHQGAQADRASIALNYFNYSENFFEPRVMESRAYHGLTGLEFPIIQYIVSLLYQLFGFHHFIYRAVMGSIVFAGCFAIWKLTGMYVLKTIHRYCIFTLWYSSPILVYYSFNYIPDIPAFSFSMIAWYYFFQYYHGLNKNKSFNLYILITTLSGLLKVTFFINHFAILGIILLQKIYPNTIRNPVIFKPKQFALYFLPFVFVSAWYYYSNYLTQLTWNHHFLQATNPAKSISDFIENTRFSFNTWGNRIYPFSVLMGVLIIWLISLIKYFKQLDIIGYIGLFLFGGFVIIFTLFNIQFRYHDYYFVVLYPCLFFIFLWLYKMHIENRSFFTGLAGLASLIAMYVLPISNSIHAKNNVKRTFTNNDYYCQNVIGNIDDYQKAKAFIDKKYPNNNEIFSAFDPSPNTSLYLLGRQGIRIAKDFNKEVVEDIFDRKFEEKDTKFLPIIVINDYQFWKNLNLEKYQISAPIFTSGNLYICYFNKIK